MSNLSDFMSASGSITTFPFTHAVLSNTYERSDLELIAANDDAYIDYFRDVSVFRMLWEDQSWAEIFFSKPEEIKNKCISNALKGEVQYTIGDFTALEGDYRTLAAIAGLNPKHYASFEDLMLDDAFAKVLSRTSLLVKNTSTLDILTDVYLEHTKINSYDMFNIMLNSAGLDISAYTGADSIAADTNAINAIMSSGQSTINCLASDDTMLRVACMDANFSYGIAQSIANLGAIVDNTLNGSSIFTKSTTTFSGQSNIVTIELPDTNTIIIPIRFEDAYPDGSSNITLYRKLWSGADTTVNIFTSGLYDADSIVYVSPQVVSMRGIAHQQTYANTAYYSIPTCDIYTVI